MNAHGTAQLNEALQEKVRDLERERTRLRALFYNGHFTNADNTKVFAQFTDHGDTKDTVTLQPGETIGQMLDTLDQKWARPFRDAQKASDGNG